MRFDAEQGGRWTVIFGDRATYDANMATTQHSQIATAGVRLTALLAAIWPD